MTYLLSVLNRLYFYQNNQFQPYLADGIDKKINVDILR